MPDNQDFTGTNLEYRQFGPGEFRVIGDAPPVQAQAVATPSPKQGKTTYALSLVVVAAITWGAALLTRPESQKWISNQYAAAHTWVADKWSEWQRPAVKTQSPPWIQHIETLNRRLEGLEGETKRLREELKRAQDAAMTTGELNNDLKAKVDELQSELAAAQGATDFARRELAASEAKTAKVLSDGADLQAALSDLREERNAAIREAKHQEQQAVAHRLESERWRGRLATAERQTEEAKDEVVHLRQKVKTLEGQIAVARTQPTTVLPQQQWAQPMYYTVPGR